MTTILTIREQRRAQREGLEWTRVREYLADPRIVEALALLPAVAAELRARAPELLPWIAQRLNDPKYPAPDADDGPTVREQLAARQSKLEGARTTLTDGVAHVQRVLDQINGREPSFFVGTVAPERQADIDSRNAYPLYGIAQVLRTLQADVADIEAVIDRATPTSAGAPIKASSGRGYVESKAPSQTHATSSTREAGWASTTYLNT
jgi:hypothetical protein